MIIDPAAFNRVIYVRKQGSDASSGLTAALAKLTIAGATAIAQDGDLILVGPGTFAEGATKINLTGNVGTVGVSLVGAGMDVTIITSSVAVGTNGSSVKHGNGSLVADLTVLDSGTGGSIFGAASTDTPFVNGQLRNVRTVGALDAIIFSNTTTPCSLSAYNCRLVSPIDGVRIIHNSGDAGRVDLYDCDIHSEPTGTFAAKALSLGIAGATAGIINATRCNISCRRPNNGSAGRQAVLNEGVGTITLWDCNIRSYSTGAAPAGTDADVANTSTGRIVLHNCTYDRTKLTNTSTGVVTERARLVALPATAPAGYGGTAIVTPLQATVVRNKVAVRDIELTQYATETIQWVCTDENGVAVNLSASGVRLTIWSDDGSGTVTVHNSYTKAAAEVSVIGASFNTVQRTMVAADTATPASRHYALWDDTTGEPLAEGRWTVKRSARNP